MLKSRERERETCNLKQLRFCVQVKRVRSQNRENINLLEFDAKELNAGVVALFAFYET